MEFEELKKVRTLLLVLSLCHIYKPEKSYEAGTL